MTVVVVAVIVSHTLHTDHQYTIRHRVNTITIAFGIDHKHSAHEECNEHMNEGTEGRKEGRGKEGRKGQLVCLFTCLLLVERAPQKEAYR